MVVRHLVGWIDVKIGCDAIAELTIIQFELTIGLELDTVDMDMLISCG